MVGKQTDLIHDWTQKAIFRPDKYLQEFKVVQCPYCGFWQITTSKDRLICSKCSRSRVFKSKGVWNVRLKDFGDYEEAKQYCLSKKQSQGEDFRSGSEC